MQIIRSVIDGEAQCFVFATHGATSFSSVATTDRCLPVVFPDGISKISI
jgi:hypothetical protein